MTVQLALPSGCQIVIAPQTECGQPPACVLEPPFACTKHLCWLLTQGFCKRCTG